MAKLERGVNDLATVNPELAKEWHPTKNGDLTPSDVMAGSHIKVWWQCGNGHEWQAVINSRSSGRACPYCANKKVLGGFNDLVTVCPDLAKEWHPIKNGDLRPNNVLAGSHRKVWWLGKCGHEWESSVGGRLYNNYGCPYCSTPSRLLLTGFNDLATLYPDLVKEWHPTKNGDLTPENIMPGSVKKVWWLGKCGHEWQASPNSRVKGTGCPVCVSEARTSFAEQAIYYYLHSVYPNTINRDQSFGMELDVYIPSLRVAVEYDGVYFHQNLDRDIFKSRQCDEHKIRLIRIREYGCPVMADNSDVIIRKKDTDKALELALEELFLKLGIEDISIDICRDRNLIMNDYMVRKKRDSLLVKRPHLATEWHSTKNGNLTPDMFTFKSHKIVWWQCGNGHEWQASIISRSKGNGCPYCANKKVLRGFNDLATVNPELTTEWHPTKNGVLKATDVLPFSNEKVWWLGNCGHEWQASVAQRSNGTGCPVCARRRVGEKHKKQVICVESDVVYDSLVMASEATGISRTNLSVCCSGKQKTAGGYHWKYVDK